MVFHNTESQLRQTSYLDYVAKYLLYVPVDKVGGTNRQKDKRKAKKENVLYAWEHGGRNRQKFGDVEVASN